MPKEVIKEQAPAFWQLRSWWRKNWWTVLLVIGMIYGVVKVFDGHTSGIADLQEELADLEEESGSLKDLIIDMGENANEYYTKVDILAADVGRIRESLDRIETILMSRDE